MYCKHCGQQIADDSKYCQYCGGIQDDVSVASSQENPNNENAKEHKVVEIPTIKANLSDSTKWWIVGCGLWLVLNLYWLFAGDKYSDASEHFMPFYSKGFEDRGSYYDISEFIVYVIGLPFAIWGLVMLNKKLNGDSGNINPPSRKSTGENNNINDALGLK